MADAANGAGGGDSDSGAMTRERRCEAIALARAADLVPLAEAVLADAPVQVLRGPTVGTLMLRARESALGQTFHLGEALVTEAFVAIGDHRGYAVVQGMERELALAGAICDAAVEAEHAAAPRILAALRDAEIRVAAARRAAWEAVAATRVAFDEM